MPAFGESAREQRGKVADVAFVDLTAAQARSGKDYCTATVVNLII